jgi:hypothetical protein
MYLYTYMKVVIALSARVSGVMKEARIEPSVIPSSATQGNYHCRLYAVLVEATILQAGYPAVDMKHCLRESNIAYTVS